MNKLFSRISDGLLPVSALFFLFFIPLFPKLPIVDIVHTWVYIRAEDLLVALVAAGFAVRLIRTRTMPSTPLTWPIVTYWLVGVVVVIVSIVATSKHIVNFHPHLAILHFLRRIEYMILFFLGYYAVKSNRGIFRASVWVIAVTVLLIILYGFGQKFLGLPAFLTMNEEFAKGIPLRLPPTARIPSTFGGHYDLGAYLVLVIPILGSMVFAMKRVWHKLVFFTLAVFGLVLLLLTASRVSFGVYLIAISAMLVWQKKRVLIIPVIIASFIIMNFVGEASERFYKTFRYENVVVDLSSGKPIGTLDKLEGSRALVEQIESPAHEDLPKGSEFIGIHTDSSPRNNVNAIEYYTASSLATGSGEIATVSGSFLIQKAFVYDISLTTRFQGQWPKAFTAFRRDVLLGSGFSTLSVAADGDYLRMLGETGIAGSIAFLGIFIAAYVFFFRQLAIVTGLPRSFAIGVYAGLTGLLCNAILIDVFEASKVAFSFWLMLGIALGSLGPHGQTIREYCELLKRTLTHQIALILYLVIGVMAIFAFILPWYFIADDFTWLKWATETNIQQIPTLFTSAQGFFYRPIPKLWYVVLYSLFWLKPGPYHFMSLVLLSLSVILIYVITSNEGVRRPLALLGSAVFAILSIHHENVYWISGQSSMLAFVALFGSIYCHQLLWKEGRSIRGLILPLATLLLFVSMLSYDGMVVAPLLVWLLGLLRYQQKGRWHHGLLLLMPLYWLMRTSAGAVVPSGDYGYKIETLFVNALANTSGYLAAIFGGPRVIEHWEFLRASFRTNKQLVAGGGVLVLACFVIVARAMRRFIGQMRAPAVFLLLCIVSLAAYAGLGGMAERYAFIPSGFLCIALGIVVERIWEKETLHVKVIALMIIVSVIYWNYRESFRLKDDWAVASRVSQQSILQLRKEYFPLSNHRGFIFVNTPIRYGRAWIFPTGLGDALWHVFRLNPFTFTTISVSSAKEAFSYPHVFNRYNREVFIFEDLQLKRLLVEVDTRSEGTNR